MALQIGAVTFTGGVSLSENVSPTPSTIEYLLLAGGGGGGRGGGGAGG